MDRPGRPIQEYLDRAVYIYNRFKGPNGYSPYFLMHGTHPPQEQQIYHAYERESTSEAEKQWSEELVRAQAANTARTDFASMKAARDATRSYLQEKKGLIWTYTTENWVLGVRQRTKKTKPLYYGPWAKSSSYPNNTYTLISPGGVCLARGYNGTHLLSAYTRDGHPVSRSCQERLCS
ncbi:hypothetical protein K3495_g13806 [Podosphaera aphanis]|nr:hypothetical protein K3495_g13806 [Podosphaera aphanis]